MVSENNIWWQRLQGWASGTPSKYGDVGDFPTMAYQMTGDPKYAQRAWSLIQPWIAANVLPDGVVGQTPSRNETRQDFETCVWMYDWLYPALTPTQRTQFIGWLNWMADLVLDKTSIAFGTRTDYSDETTG